MIGYSFVFALCALGTRQLTDIMPFLQDSEVVLSGNSRMHHPANSK